MHTALCDTVGIEYPIFAFTHCRDVAVAVSRAGGLGVLGAVGLSPEQLEIELNWMDEHVDGMPYGVDVVMPQKSLDVHGSDRADLVGQIRSMIDQEHWDFVDELMTRFDLPPLPEGTQAGGVVGWTEDVARQLVDVAFGHPMALIANALGSPPKDIVDRAHEHGVKVAALAGKAQHAQRHVNNGVDIVIAQGYEAGGHTGEIATMVLVPEVVKAVSPTPVLAAGGIGTGAQIAAVARARCAGCVDGLALAGDRRVELEPGGHRGLHGGDVVRHGALALVHRKARAHAAQRVDRRVGRPGRSRPARHAPAEHPHRGGERTHRARAPQGPPLRSRSVRSSAA